MQEEGPGACNAGKRDLQPCQVCHPEERDESLWAYIHASVNRGNKHLLGVRDTNNTCTCPCARTRERCVHPREVNSGNTRNCTGEPTSARFTHRACAGMPTCVLRRLSSPCLPGAAAETTLDQTVCLACDRGPLRHRQAAS